MTAPTNPRARLVSTDDGDFLVTWFKHVDNDQWEFDVYIGDALGLYQYVDTWIMVGEYNPDEVYEEWLSVFKEVPNGD